MYQLANIPYVAALGKGTKVVHHQRTQRDRLQHMVGLEIMRKPPTKIVVREE